MKNDLKFINTFETSLFLGFLVDSSFQKEFNFLDPRVKSLFIQNGDSYLHEHFCNGSLFLGKFIGKSSDYPNLELSSLNIYSLLKKIVPNYSYDQSELWLIPVIKGE